MYTINVLLSVSGKYLLAVWWAVGVICFISYFQGSYFGDSVHDVCAHIHV